MAIGLALALPAIQFDKICVVTGIPRTLFIYGYVILCCVLSIGFVSYVQLRSGCQRGLGKCADHCLTGP
ncbi:hypothetical protein CPB84DRAFT_1773031 [Gymnopilus junonius]|uniref:Uncharacterized protein n=1 Tax=Gymnopilus junonius TaxID=109634 RepID=A0A9P5NPU6_GYMJU|nr:hypothetical protein CPB84DRAFT_1773031 [Gymnopilus junonius]